MTEEILVDSLTPTFLVNDLKSSPIISPSHVVHFKREKEILDASALQEVSLCSEKTFELTKKISFNEMRKSLIARPLVSNDGRYLCPFCKKTFSQKYIVPRHIKSMHENAYQRCQICNQSVKNIQQHRKFRHSERNLLKCVICDESIMSKKLLREHLSNNHGKITLPSRTPEKKSCKICGAVLNSKKSIWLGHIYYQHMIPSNYFKCPVDDCPKTISKLEDDFNLKNHLLSHHNFQVDKVYHCHLCPSKLLSQDDYNGHLEIDHDSKSHVNCVICEKTFCRYQLMALHLYVEHRSIFRGTLELKTNLMWSIVKLPEIKKETLKKQLNPQIFESAQKFKPKSTKYTFLKSSACHVPQTETIIPKHSENFYNNVEQNFNLDFNEKILENTSNDGQMIGDLPPGTKVIQATETEIIIEVDSGPAPVTNLSTFNISEPFESLYPIPVIEKEDEAWDDPDQHSVSDGQTSENADATEVILLNNNYENTVEVDDMRGFEFTDEQEAKRRPKQKGKFNCPIQSCQKSFVAKHSVKMHLRNVHHAQKVYCQKCGKIYSNQDNLKVHMIKNCIFFVASTLS